MGTADTAMHIAATGTLVSIGYEGKTVDDLVAQLLERSVRVLVDVRLTPLSRKPGLSKTKLAEALRAAGIDYVHHRALGNPRDNRAGFRAGEPESLMRYREVLDTTDATDALAHVCELLDGGVVALLCFEQDHAECHRNVVETTREYRHCDVSTAAIRVAADGARRGSIAARSGALMYLQIAPRGTFRQSGTVI
ncbi:hypothetical protein MINS_27290 [Mycolicibacterium insubricum]|jgi:uncharacterized protein (DUF488 family)|uniref:DUF488 domain-containing protein n=1 Tax=Mycolicibacterium insubricum TaxID=444597 RepID=UPI00138DC51C|nr:DUF488 domain-containing protein [Mycolicibacterium insubricum]BBZ67300.1 hypothetical protein MINS_27290 [Mycolicibacterium insubricum]